MSGIGGTDTRTGFGRALAAAALLALTLDCSSRSISSLAQAYRSFHTRFGEMIVAEFSELVDGALAYRNSRGRWPDDGSELRTTLMSPDRPRLRYRYLAFEDRGRGLFEAVFHASHSPRDARVDSLEYHGVARLTIPWPADGPVAGCDLEISIFETVIQDADDLQVDKSTVTVISKRYVPGQKVGAGKFISGGVTVFEMRMR